MVTNEALLLYAEARGHEVFFQRLETVESLTVELEKDYVAISDRLDRRDEKVKLAHELGHCEYGGFYNRYSHFDIWTRAEHRADKWAYLRLAPPGEVREAFRQGCVEACELAERFEVTEDFLKKAMAYYKREALI